MVQKKEFDDENKPSGKDIISSGKPAAKETKKNSAKEMLKVIIYAVVIAVVLKLSVVDTRVIISGSMLPTIEISDRVILNRLAYVGKLAPHRGDIIVFTSEEKALSNEDLIKRVVALPGETVEIKYGSVYIDGKALSEDYIAEKPLYDYGPVTIPDNCYFLLGDNRNNSYDSHLWLNPFVPEDDIKGEAVCCYWPLDSISLY